MYRGVVRIFPVPQPVSPADEPVLPVERELTRAVNSLKADMEKLEENLGGVAKWPAHTQTDPQDWAGAGAEAPLGYAIPRVFVRSVAEAVEQAVIAYCPSLTSSAQREKAMLRLLQQVAEYATAPRHLYFETFETNPQWYDYMKITVFDHVTANILATADLIPPVSRVVLPNVNTPLYDSPVIQNDSVPHLPQVELSFLQFNQDERNRVIGQSVTVPLDLFVAAGNVLTVLEDGSEREVSYKSTLVRYETLPN